jgi:hypothetical protein
MSEENEKPLEQIHYESLRKSYVALRIAPAGTMMPWDEVDNKRKEGAATAAQAVIAEFLRRNGEPVAWVEVKDSYEGPYEFHGIKLLGVGKHNLFAAPQPQLNNGEPIGWLNVKYGTFFFPAQIAATGLNEERIASGELIKVFAAPQPLPSVGEVAMALKRSTFASPKDCERAAEAVLALLTCT